MSPKEKAEQLINTFITRFINDTKIRYQYAIVCALIAVDEILSLNAESFDTEPNPHHLFSRKYWQEVKNELLKQQNNE